MKQPTVLPNGPLVWATKQSKAHLGDYFMLIFLPAL